MDDLQGRRVGSQAEFEFAYKRFGNGCQQHRSKGAPLGCGVGSFNQWSITMTSQSDSSKSGNGNHSSQGNRSSQGNQSGGQSKGDQSETGDGERGFGAMDPKEQREIARKGGEAVSEDREHMAEIGRKGGEATAERNEEGSSGSEKSGGRSGSGGSGSTSGGGSR